MGMFRGEISIAEVARLTFQLPQKSRFVQEAGGDAVRWDYTDHLLADVIDQLNQIHFWTANGALVYSKDEHAAKKLIAQSPPAIKRPGVETGEAEDTAPRVLTKSADIKEFFGMHGTTKPKIIHHEPELRLGGS